LLALQPSDLNVADPFLSVTRTFLQHGETSTKTDAGAREVDLAPKAVAMLLAMLDGRTTGRLFDLTIDELRRALESLKLKSHSLRHFRYTHLERHKVHAAIHAFWIGHSMGGLRKIYGHIEEDRELRQKIAREIGIGFSLPVGVQEMVTA
jgi:integrase